MGWSLASVLVIVAAVATYAIASSRSGNQSAAPRERTYTSQKACLLTGTGGVASNAAAPVWSGMQDASKATKAMASYLTVSGAQTPDNAVPFLNTLVAQHCDVIVAVGDAETAAVKAQAAVFPAASFVTVAGAPVTAPNVATVPGGPAVPGSVKSVVVAALGGHFKAGPVSGS